MTRTFTLILISLLLLLAFGCGGTTETDVGAEATTADAGTEETTTTDTTKAEEAGAIAKEIAGNPDGADGILTSHDTTQAKFEELLYEIAADPVLTEAYQAARK
jgi:ABC-type glycerol-3-phosphate transport system substrate-binding protein